MLHHYLLLFRVCYEDLHFFITQSLGSIYIQRMQNVNNETLKLFLEVNSRKAFPRSSILAIDFEANTNLPDMNIHSHLNTLLCCSEILFQLNGT